MADFLVKKGLQAGYNGLESKDENTVYYCTDSGNMYLGETPLFESAAFKAATLSGKKVNFTTHGSNGTAGSAQLDLSSFATTAEQTAAIKAVTDLIGTGFSSSSTVSSQLAAVKTTADGAASDLSDHVADKDNPHEVTKDQVGLGKVENKTVAEILANAALTGVPTAPTAATSVSNTQVASTAFVQSVVNEKISSLSSALVFQGTLGTDGTVAELPANHKVGYVYVVATAGTYAGAVCEVGDMVICVKDGSTAANGDWTVVQTNINGAVTASDTLVADQVVVGAGGKASKTLAAGSNGQVLKMVNGKPAWGADTDNDTTYTFANGTDGSFSVTPKGGSAQKVTIGKPATAGTADKVGHSLTVNGTAFDGSADKSVSITPASIGAATSAQGAKADSAVQEVATGSANGTISVDGDDVPVKGLGSAAYTASSAYATSAQGGKADTALQTVSASGAGYLTMSAAAKSGTTQAISGSLTVQAVAGASSSAKGLAESSDVKAYVDAQVGAAKLQWGTF